MVLSIDYVKETGGCNYSMKEFLMMGINNA
jgi:hypothetical protein